MLDLAERRRRWFEAAVASERRRKREHWLWAAFMVSIPLVALFSLWAPKNSLSESAHASRLAHMQADTYWVTKRGKGHWTVDTEGTTGFFRTMGTFKTKAEAAKNARHLATRQRALDLYQAYEQTPEYDRATEDEDAIKWLQCVAEAQR